MIKNIPSVKIKATPYNFKEINNPKILSYEQKSYCKSYCNTFLGKDLISLCKKYPKGESASFFGVDSITNLYNKIHNQCALSYLKQKELNFAHFPFTNLVEFEKGFNNRVLKNQPSYIEQLFDKGAAKVTFTDKCFKFNNEPFQHTIGLVKDKHNNIYIIDSLGNSDKNIAEFHGKLKNILTSNKNPYGLKINNVIINKKQQQSNKELTCSNWTIANLEAIQNQLTKGEIIKDSKALDNILPNNINTILDAQHKYLIDNKNLIPEFLK